MHREVYILLLTISIFISISVFEILLALGLIYTVYTLLKDKNLSGKFSFPIFIYAADTLISTFIFNRQFFVKSIEEGFFQFIYFFKVKNINFLWLRNSIIKAFIFFGIILIPVAIYRYLHEGKTLLLWGSSFETGHFYAVFSIVSFLAGLYFYKQNRKELSYLFFFLMIVFSFIVIFSFRRTAFLEFVIGLFLIGIVLYKNKILKTKEFVSLLVFLVVFSVADYTFMSYKDYRFQQLNKVLKKSDSLEKDLNLITSSRYVIFLDAIDIIKTDIKEKNWINILIGHGIRCGSYLPHKHDKEWKIYGRERYESVFLISEFIERGLIGLFAILWIFFSAFKFLFRIKVSNMEEGLFIIFLVPLILHLIGITFTFFWDALLPLYFLLFKVGEEYFERHSV